VKQLFSISPKQKNKKKKQSDARKRFSDEKSLLIKTIKKIIALFSSTCYRRNTKEHFGVCVGQKKRKER
jgi:hypothetical protein